MEDFCSCHSKHKSKITDFSESFRLNHSEHIDIWNAVKDKVSNKLFYLLVVLIIGNLAFQWGIYDNLKTVQTSVAVIETKLHYSTMFGREKHDHESYGKTK